MSYTGHAHRGDRWRRIDLGEGPMCSFTPCPVPFAADQPCEWPGCDRPATHKSGFGNIAVMFGCVEHTNHRASTGAWFRSIP